MKVFTKFHQFFTSPYYFVKGLKKFTYNKYSEAITYFEKCLEVEDDINEVFYSYYGQSLCAAGRYQEANKYLLAAYQLYAKQDWKFENKHLMDVANNTLSALKYINQNTNIVIEAINLEVMPVLENNK